MHVIKLGGSLTYSNALQECLQTIMQAQEKIVLVAGGGFFADQIRIAQTKWQFDDVTAHAMALLAMQQNAWFIKSLQTKLTFANSTTACLQQTTPCLWMPDVEELNKAGIKPSWNVTSDSLAAWLATQLNADKLTLVKMAEINTNNLAQLQQQGIIDEAFLSFVQQANFETQVIYYKNLSLQ